MSEVAAETLTDEEISDLEVRFSDKTPTTPCVHCGAVDWTVAAMGRGRVSWACARAKEIDREARSLHYAMSHHETVSGNTSVISLIAEVRRFRAAASNARKVGR